MSKFVTYGVTEMLDNDQKFIIDSDRTGPGSITAKDAASSFLSKWAGFETFEEAVQNTISNNQEFIDRDTAIRSETAELKKKIVTTFPAKDASGAVATFESEFEDAPLKSCIVQIEPVQNLHGYDSPWPAGGGKNLLPYTFNDTGSANGITWTKNNDGSIVFSGTCPIPTSTLFVDFKLPTGDYLFSNVGSTWSYTGGSRPFVYIRDIDNAVSLAHIEFGQSTNGVSFSLSTTTNVRFYAVFQDNNVVSGVLYPMIRLATETDASYAPYSNECPITGWTGCEVQRTGKNLLTRDGEIENSYVTRYGDIRIGVGWILSDFIHVKGSTQYHFNPNSAEGGTAKHACFNSQKQCIGYYDSGERMFVTQADCAFMRFSYRSSSTDVQLELGSTPTPYEPYTGQTYPITFPTEAGTVYGAYVDVLNGELVVDRAIYRYEEFAGKISSDATNVYGYVRFICDFNNDKKQGITNVSSNLFPTHYATIPQSTDFEAISGHSSLNGVYLSINESRLSGDLSTSDGRAAAIRNWSRENGLEICYELAEPIHYPLTPTEIKTLLGTNNIWSNTGDTAVEYLMSDVSWYVEKKLKAFQSVLAGVEDSAVASKNYSTDSYLIFNDDIYRVTKTITAGETIEEGVNVTKTTVAEQLMALAQA